MIALRAPEPSDLDMLYRWENDSSQWHTSLTPVHVSRHRLWEYINNFDGDVAAWGQLKLMAMTKSEGGDNSGVGEAELCVGTVDLYDIDLKSAHAFIGIYVAEEYRQKGFGVQIIAQLCEYASRYLGINVVAALAAENNMAGRRLFEKSGFSVCGTLPRWIRQGKEFVAGMMYVREL